MRIELRNIKYAAFASEETSCFEATVYVDGKKVGEAHNDGHGGSTLIFPRELEERINAYAKTLPDEVTDLPDPHDESKPFVMKQTAESIIDNLLNDYLTRRDLQRLLSKRLVWKSSDGKLRETAKVMDKATLAKYVALGDSIKQKLRDCVECLNVMPFDKALELYKQK